MEPQLKATDAITEWVWQCSDILGCSSGRRGNLTVVITKHSVFHWYPRCTLILLHTATSHTHASIRLLHRKRQPSETAAITPNCPRCQGQQLIIQGLHKYLQGPHLLPSTQRPWILKTEFKFQTFLTDFSSMLWTLNYREAIQHHPSASVN